MLFFIILASLCSIAATEQTITLTPIADTYISCFPNEGRSLQWKKSEQGANAGATKRLKIKGHENHPLLKFDFSAIPKGAAISKAELVVTMTGDSMLLNHVCAWSLHVDWNEGTGTWDDKGKPDLCYNGACFFGPKGVNSRWRDYDESDFSHAALGNGGNAVSVTRARALGNGRFAIDIDPYVVHAAIQNGNTIALTDEIGVWNACPDMFFYSRESGKTAPILSLTWTRDRDTVAPAFDSTPSAWPGPDPGTVLVYLPHAGDDGLNGDALGYSIFIDNKEVPRVLIPRPRQYNRNALIHGITHGKTVGVKITAFDKAGNTASYSIKTKAQEKLPGILEKTQVAKQVPRFGKARGFDARLVDGLTLYDPLTGGLSPGQKRGKVDKDASVGEWTALRGEILGMQVLVKLRDSIAALDKISVTLQGKAGGPVVPGSSTEYFCAHYVKIKDSWYADILPPVLKDGTLSIPSQNNLQGQRLLAMYTDLIIPKNAAPGKYAGRVRVSVKGDTATIPVSINVVDLTMPDSISFVIEMNAYDHSSNLVEFLAMYRLCHKHRLSYNVVAYGHKNPGSFTTPKINGKGKNAKITDWSAYDKFYGPLFSGEAAFGLPRDQAPATHWYLPFHEGWPASLSVTDTNTDCWNNRMAPDKDREQYLIWVDKMCRALKFPGDHFVSEWREANAAVAKQFTAHFKEKGWTRTDMQVFSNHKYYFASGSQSLWCMDEPQFGRDFRALDWFHSFYKGLFSDGGARFVFRADISRPEWGGALYDKGLDLSVGYPDWDERLLKDKIKAFNYRQWWYGGGGNADADPTLYPSLFLKKWSQGCSGGLPSWTFVSSDTSWDTTNALRYVVYSRDGKQKPVSTVRMKACRYGQQFVELLNMVSGLKGFNRWHVADLAAKEAPVNVRIISEGPEDPGYSEYEGLDVSNIERLRAMLIATLLYAQKE